MTNTIAIIDYGSGNLRSAAKAFAHVIAQNALPYQVVVTDDQDVVQKAERIVLPGQGAFADCMAGLSALPGMTGMLEQKVIKDGAPFFGICVGMQLMATRGLEHGVHAGLGWIPGDVVPIPVVKGLKIPHMGWNDLTAWDASHPVLRSIESSDEASKHFYFVHSFMFDCKDKQHRLAMTGYGSDVSAIVGRDNMIGTQFHPEKSQQAGLSLIENFITWRP